MKSDNNNLFKCESEYNLEEIKFSKNLTHENEVNVNKYLNNKVKKSNDEIKKNKEFVMKYENSKYDYDLECLKNSDYKMSYILINIYLFVFNFIGIFWIIFGIHSMHSLVNLGVEGKLNTSFNERDDSNRNSTNSNINNMIEIDSEGNQLISNNK